MIEIFKLIGRIAKSDAAVLIQGESGTGKELVARTIHENSRRAGKPFLAVNCAAIPETLLESELFGHEKGAFTGAAYSRKGKFELSHGGTIFLDEVGIIAATNKSLVECIQTSDFRVDLFYRLKVVSIFLPSLSRRPGDVPLLIEHFIQKYRRHAKSGIRGISRRALAFLESQRWTGNVRELENAIQTAVVLNRTGMLDVEDFPFLHDRSRSGESPESEGEVLKRLAAEAAQAARVLLSQGDDSVQGEVYRDCVGSVERSIVGAALDHCGGNQVRASRLLGISRNTLRSKMAPVDRAEARS